MPGGRKNKEKITPRASDVAVVHLACLCIHLPLKKRILMMKSLSVTTLIVPLTKTLTVRMNGRRP